jgi:hypothetical protein
MFTKVEPKTAPAHIILTLSEGEMVHASTIGATRQVQGIRGKGTHGIDQRLEGFHSHCHGAMAESGVAKYLGLPWDGALGNFKAKDVGSKYQVRSTDWQSGCLIVHKGDDENDIWILVTTHDLPYLHLCGWISGEEVKRDIHLKNPHNRGESYFIKQRYLSPMETVPRYAT